MSCFKTSQTSTHSQPRKDWMLTSKLYVSGWPERMDVTWMMDLEMAGFFRQQKKTVEGKVVYISTIIYDGGSKKTSKKVVGNRIFEASTV